MLSSNPKSTSSQIINPAFRNHPFRQPPVNPGHLHIPCPPLSVVKFLKNNSTGTLQLVRFVEDSHYAAFRKRGQVFLPNIFMPGAKKILSKRDASEPAFTNLCHYGGTFCDSKRSVTDPFTIELDAALFNHPQSF